MKRLLFLPLLFFAAAIPALGQCQSYTLVSGTITDPNGIPYAGNYPGGATITADLAGTGGQTATCNPASGGTRPQFSTHIGPTPVQSNGSFTLQLPPNAIITPVSTQWTFTVATGGVAPPWGSGPQQFTYTVTISGASQSISSGISALAPSLLCPGCAAGGGGMPAGNIGDLQDKASSTMFGAAHINDGGTVAGQLTVSENSEFINDAIFKSGKPWYDVTAYGAKCDGSTDDTAAFTAAVAAQEASGGVVYVPRPTSPFSPCVVNLSAFAHTIVGADSWLYVLLDNSLIISGGSISGSRGIAFVGRTGTLTSILGGFIQGPAINITAINSSTAAMDITNSSALYFEGVNFTFATSGTQTVPPLNVHDTTGTTTNIQLVNVQALTNNCASVPAMSFVNTNAGSGASFNLGMDGISTDCGGSIGTSIVFRNFGIVRCCGPKPSFIAGTVKIDATGSSTGNFGDITIANVLSENLNNQDFIDFEGGSGNNVSGVWVHDITFADFVGNVYLFKQNVQNLNGFHFSSYPTNNLTAIRDPASSFSNLLDFSCTGDNGCNDTGLGGPNLSSLGAHLTQSNFGASGQTNEIVNNDPAGTALTLRGVGKGLVVKNGGGTPVVTASGAGLSANAVSTPGSNPVVSAYGVCINGVSACGGDVAITSPIPSGVRLVVGQINTSCGGTGLGCNVAPVDPSSNAYTKIYEVTPDGFQDFTFWATCVTSPIPGGVSAIHNSGSPNVIVWEVVDGACPVNVDSPSGVGNSAASSATPTYPTTNTTGYQEEIFQILDTSGGVSMTPGSGWTLDPSGSGFFGFQRKFVASPSAVTPTITFNSAVSSWTAYIGVPVGAAIGSSPAPWPNIYANNLQLTGATTCGTPGACSIGSLTDFWTIYASSWVFPGGGAAIFGFPGACPTPPTSPAQAYGICLVDSNGFNDEYDPATLGWLPIAMDSATVPSGHIPQSTGVHKYGDSGLTVAATPQISGTPTATHCVNWATATTLGDAGSACGSGSGANAALSNLSAVSINTSLLAQTGVDAGSTTKPFRNLFLFGAGTYGTTYLELTGTPTSTRTVTFPDATDTVAELAATQTLTNKTISGASNTLSSIGLSSLASQAADTVDMNASGSSAAPTAVAMPTSGTNGCAGTSNALTYNTSTHALGCNTISGNPSYVNTTTQTVANTTTATNLQAITITPAVNSGQTLHLVFRGLISDTTSSPTLQVALVQGGTSGGTTGTALAGSDVVVLNNTTALSGASWECQVDIIPTAASGSAVASWIEGLCSAVMSRQGHGDVPTLSWSIRNNTTINVNTTAGQTYAIQVTWGTASASNTISGYLASGVLF